MVEWACRKVQILIVFNMENSKTNCGRKAQIPIISEMTISKDNR
jgi:hypothetical protein